MQIETIPPVAKVKVTFMFEELMDIKNALNDVLNNENPAQESLVILNNIKTELDNLQPD